MAIVIKSKMTKGKPSTSGGQPKAKATPSKKKTAKKQIKEFEVRPGTAAVCARWMGKDMAAGRLFHGLLELWVETKKKIVRVYDGEQKEFLFLSSGDIMTLTGLTKSQLDKAMPVLKDRPFFIIKTGRIAPGTPNRYQIHFDAECFWEEVEDELKIATGVTEAIAGFELVKKELDRKALPYLFKRLWDEVFAEG